MKKSSSKCDGPNGRKTDGLSRIIQPPFNIPADPRRKSPKTDTSTKLPKKYAKPLVPKTLEQVKQASFSDDVTGIPLAGNSDEDFVTRAVRYAQANSVSPAVRLLRKIKPTQGLEEKLRARRESDAEVDLDEARIYFTKEAARLIACAKLGALMDTNPFKTEQAKRKSQANPATAEEGEMNAFDITKKIQPNIQPDTGIYFEHQPSEKSFNDLKLKVEILKRQRERDVQAAAERNRCRKSFFRQMLPSFSDVIRNDLMDYSMKRASRLSEEELTLASVTLGIADQRKIFEEHQQYTQEELVNIERQNFLKAQKHKDQNEKMQSLMAKFETHDRNRYTHETLMRKQEMNEHLIKDILDVVLDVVGKISHYRNATGQNPSERLFQEWKAIGFAALNEQDMYEKTISCSKPNSDKSATGAADLLNELRINDYLTCTGEWSLDSGFSESFQTPANETLQNFVECIVETLVTWPRTHYPKLFPSNDFSRSEDGELVDSHGEEEEESEKQLQKKMLLSYLKQLPKEMLETIANYWMNMETNFLRVLSTVLSNVRRHLDAVTQHAADMRARFTDILERTDERQAIISSFQDEFNNIDEEIRLDSDVKTELHARVDELVRKLEAISNDKYDHSKDEIFSLLNDGYFQTEVKIQMNLFIAILQAETERYIETILFINEFCKAFQSMLENRNETDDLAEFDLEGINHLRHHFDWDIDTEGSRASTYDSDISLPENPLLHETPHIRLDSKDEIHFDDREEREKQKSSSTQDNEYKPPAPAEILPEAPSPQLSEDTDGKDVISSEVSRRATEVGGEDGNQTLLQNLQEALLNIKEELYDEEELEKMGGGDIDKRNVDFTELQQSASVYSFDAGPGPNIPREYELFDPIEYFGDESIFFEQDEYFEDEIRPDQVSLTPSEEDTDNLSINTDDDDSALVGDEDSPVAVLTSESSIGEIRGFDRKLQLSKKRLIVEGDKNKTSVDTGTRKGSILSSNSKGKKDKKDDGRPKKEIIVNVIPAEKTDEELPIYSDVGGENALKIDANAPARLSVAQRQKDLSVIKKHESQTGRGKKSEVEATLVMTAAAALTTHTANQEPTQDTLPPVVKKSKKKRRPKKPNDFSSSTEEELEKHWKEMHSLMGRRVSKQKSSQSQTTASGFNVGNKEPGQSQIASDSPGRKSVRGKDAQSNSLLETLNCKSCSNVSLKMDNEMYHGLYGDVLRGPQPPEIIVVEKEENDEIGTGNQPSISNSGGKVMKSDNCRDRGGRTKFILPGSRNTHAHFVNPLTAASATTAVTSSCVGESGGKSTTRRNTFCPIECKPNEDDTHHHHHHFHQPVHHHEFDGADKQDFESDQIIDEILFDEKGEESEDSEYIDMVDVTYVTADTGKPVRRTFLDQIVDNQVEAFYYFDAISDHLKSHVRKVEHFVISTIRQKYPTEPPPPPIILVPESAKKEYAKRSTMPATDLQSTDPQEPRDSTQPDSVPVQIELVEISDQSIPNIQQVPGQAPPQPPNTPINTDKTSKLSITGGEAGDSGKQIVNKRSFAKSKLKAKSTKGKPGQPSTTAAAGGFEEQGDSLVKPSGDVRDSKGKNGVSPAPNIMGGIADVDEESAEEDTPAENSSVEPTRHHPRPLTPREAALKEFMFPQGLVAYPSDPIIREMTVPAEGSLRERVQMWQTAFQFESVRVKYQLSLVEGKALQQLSQFKSIITHVLQDAKTQASNFFVDEVKRANEVANLFRFAIENETGVQSKIIIERDQLYLDQQTEETC